MTRIQQAFDKFKKESEDFFVTKFLVGNELKKQYSECLDIIFNLSGTMDSGRGVMASNPKYGQGKSFFFEVIQHRWRRTTGRNLFFRTTASELCRVYKNAPNNENPEDVLEQFIKVKRLFIDDIGDELKNGEFTHHYNNKLNVIRWVLLKRYEWFVDDSKRWITHGTTNLTIEQIGSNYDGRVADRLLQMTYFKEFDFLGDDQTFRQISETRMLTPQEIAENWKKYEKAKQDIEQIDLEKYFNELMAEPDEYFEGKDASFWKFVRDYLERKELLTKADFDRIDEQMLDSSELILKRDTRETTRMEFQHAPGSVRKSLVDKAVSGITRKNVYKTAENMIARKKFMELRTNKHTFK
jgi:DNA replication protein DnaC